WAKTEGKTLLDILYDMYVEYGLYKESLVNVVRKGKEGAEEIRAMMENFRANPPKSICGSPVSTVRDYHSGLSLDIPSGKTIPINIERSNVLQYLCADGTIVSVRPSGTEPKIKFYLGAAADNKEKIKTRLLEIENIVYKACQ
ncbi:MAG: phospho-sugar mutase, partial [Oscillospiraceae bacterium]|nr:phospho-sugar mutase [Oscillospiraceae bacterium]